MMLTLLLIYVANSIVTGRLLEYSPNLPVRLNNSFGNSSREGRLEIYYLGRWGTVCDDGFTDANARVACASLGFLYNGSVIGNRYGAGSDPIWLDDVNCTGTETGIEQCRHLPWGDHNCGHSEDVSISCVCDGYFSGPSGTISSPNYGANYSNNLDCNSYISVPSGQKIIIEFWAFKTEPSYDWVTIKCASGNYFASPYFSGSQIPETLTISFCSLVTVSFHTDGSITDRGFRLGYTIISAATTASNTSTTRSSTPTTTIPTTIPTTTSTTTSTTTPTTTSTTTPTTTSTTTPTTTTTTPTTSTTTTPSERLSMPTAGPAETRSTTPRPPRPPTAKTTRGPPRGINFASVGPLRGPIAGGTTVTISGTWPSEDVSVTGVFIGNEIKGIIVEVSRLWGVDQVIFETPPTDEVDNLMLKVQFSGYYPDPQIYTTFNLSTEKYFTYSENPRIWEVFPREHLVSGGTMLTAVGSNLTSVGYAAIQAMVEVCRYSAYGEPVCSRNSNTRPCEKRTVENRVYPTELVCTMPQIDLPSDFFDILDNITVPSNLTPNITHRDKRDVDTLNILSRLKRSAPEGSVQSVTGSNGRDTANIYLRFTLDGFQGNELNRVLQDSRFYFFTVPEITSSHEVVYFDPSQETTIPIKGRHMLRGCAKEDYRIRLGKGNCSIDQLMDNQLTCTPPDTAPENNNEFDNFCDKRFTIVVSIGDKIYYYRCLEYAGSSPSSCSSDYWNNSNCSWKWKQTVLIVGLVIGLVLLLVVIILIICLIVACTRNRKRPREEATRKNHLRPMGVIHGSLGGNHTALNGCNSMSADYLGTGIQDYFTAAAAKGNQDYLTTDDRDNQADA